MRQPAREVSFRRSDVTKELLAAWDESDVMKEFDKLNQKPTK